MSNRKISQISKSELTEFIGDIIFNYDNSVQNIESF